MNEECRFWSGLCSFPIRLDTLYIGGGTPTLLDGRQWSRLFEILEEYFVLDAAREMSVEANPGSLLPEHLEVWRDNGVTRVSVGVQSVHDDELAWLARLHNGDEAVRALECVVEKGFRCSADLLFGLAGQTLRSFAESLRRVLEIGVEHVSTYHLTLEPGTPWGNVAPSGMPEGYPFYRFAQWFLPAKGLSHYEIASFCRPGAECVHNMTYWNEDDVLALGASASGHLSGLRYTNVTGAPEYILRMKQGKSPVDTSEILSPGEKAREAAILLLRTRQGILYPEFRSRYGSELLGEILTVLDSFRPDFFVRRDDSVALSPRGMRIANRIWEEIL